jgi:histidinol dehydrogenase
VTAPDATGSPLGPDGPRLSRVDLRGRAHDAAAVGAVLPRAALDVDAAAEVVRPVVDDVRRRGLAAVLEATARFDRVELTSTRVPAVELQRALDALEPAVRAALEESVRRARVVHTAQLRPDETVQVAPGGTVTERWVPVRRVGLYAPGGLVAYPSSVVMNVVPAQVAGVRSLAVASPPQRDTGGLPHPSVLAACALLGVEEVYAVGGAQAVAALALGTERIPRVDLVVGPGNAYVEEAKRRLFGEVGIESLAGPSELVVVADQTAPIEPIAWDLLAQLEHGPGAQSVLVSTDPDVLSAVAALLPPASAAVLIEADSLDTALAFVNAHAPEHVQLVLAGADEALERIHHAGAIFVGPYAGAAFGDYIAGSNHILPTGGHSRFSSGLGPGAFIRTQEVVEVSAEACERLAPSVEVLADAEGFPGHGRSAKVRVETLARETGRVG